MADQNNNSNFPQLPFAAGQLAKALATVCESENRVTRKLAERKIEKWLKVIERNSSGFVVTGSRTPVSDTPVWVTLEVVNGGFATGELLAGGSLKQHENKLIHEFGVKGRQGINYFYISESGLPLLWEYLETGLYCIETPEEGALLSVAWLLKNERADAAREILEVIMPWFDRIRFFPKPTVHQPASEGGLISVQSVKEVVDSLAAVKQQEQVLKQQETIEIWNPFFDRMINTFLMVVDPLPVLSPDCNNSFRNGDVQVELVTSPDWLEKIASLLDEYKELRKHHHLCSRPTNKKGNFAQLRLMLEEALKSTIDLAQFVRKPERILSQLNFVNGNTPLLINAYVGLPISLDFSAEGAGVLSYHSSDKPEEARLDAESGGFSWIPQQVKRYSFTIEVSDGKTVEPRRVHILVAKDRSAAMQAMRSVYDPKIPYKKETLEECTVLFKQAALISKQKNDKDFWPEMLKAQLGFNNLEILTPTLPDGSVAFPGLVVDSNIGEAIGLLIDGNDDTFPVLPDAGLEYLFDFGEDYRMTFTGFAIEGRMNFDERSENTMFFGSNDRREWIELSDPSERSSEMVKVKVPKKRQKDAFRYLRLTRDGRYFEPSELRIYGTRHESE